MIVIDFETRSKADLLAKGAELYAEHKSTDILCLALYDMTTDAKIVFDPFETKMPKQWKDLILTTDLVAAHNAAFDKAIWNNVGIHEYGFPQIPDSKWYCSSAQMRVNALPASLEDAGLAAKVINKKDGKGSMLIRKLSIPQKDGEFLECPKLMKEMMDYCMKDVLSTVDLIRKTRMMTSREHKDWLLSEDINQRGIKVDIELAILAQDYASEEQAEINGKLTKLTDGAITKATQHQRIKKYVLGELDMTDENDKTLEKYMTIHKDGEKKHSLDKNIRESIITAIDAGNLHLFEEIESLIRLLDEASASSVAKFGRMEDRAHPVTDRVRGAFIYAGASQTQRFASKGLQVHNMKRVCYNADDAEEVKMDMLKGKEVKNVMQTLSKLLRPALIPEYGNLFVVNDWSAIEARALPWLSGDARAEVKLDLFRADVDVYVKAAQAMGIEDRQIGKVAELSLGYGGAVGAFMAMAKNYGLVLPEHQVKRIVTQWRATNAWAVDFWKSAGKAAMSAVRAKGQKQFKAGKVVYTYAPALLGGTLLCILPDDTVIQYPYCRIQHSDRGDNLVALKAAVRPKAGETEWGTVRLWGGLLVENICQAFCAGLLRDKIRDCDELELDVIGHVHDEIIIECKDTETDNVKKAIQNIMESVPDYAKGLPLKAVPEVMRRYGK